MCSKKCLCAVLFFFNYIMPTINQNDFDRRKKARWIGCLLYKLKKSFLLNSQLYINN